MQDVRKRFARISGRQPEIADYLKIALLHHHPFSFDARNEPLISRLLRPVGWHEENWLRLKDARAFLPWSEEQHIPLVLHGHKHGPRHVRQRLAGEKPAYLDAIGCGTSLGAENQPLSYNVVTWDPASRSWASTFFEDLGDGKGFAPIKVGVHHASSAK